MVSGGPNWAVCLFYGRGKSAGGLSASQAFAASARVYRIQASAAARVRIHPVQSDSTKTAAGPDSGRREQHVEHHPDDPHRGDSDCDSEKRGSSTRGVGRRREATPSVFGPVERNLSYRYTSLRSATRTTSTSNSASETE